MKPYQPPLQSLGGPARREWTLIDWLLIYFAVLAAIAMAYLCLKAVFYDPDAAAIPFSTSDSINSRADAAPAGVRDPDVCLSRAQVRLRAVEEWSRQAVVGAGDHFIPFADLRNPRSTSSSNSSIAVVVAKSPASVGMSAPYGVLATDAGASIFRGTRISEAPQIINQLGFASALGGQSPSSSTPSAQECAGVQKTACAVAEDCSPVAPDGPRSFPYRAGRCETHS